MLTKLLQLQEDIYNYYTSNDEEFERGYHPTLMFFPMGDKFSIYYNGPGYDDDPSTKAVDLEEDYNFGFCALLDFLIEQSCADHIISLVFDGADEGANGVQEWDFTRLIQSNVQFPFLEEFKIKLTDPGDHNTSSINYLDEDGTIANLVSRMSLLQHLVVPAAPDSTFFELHHEHLLRMVVQTESGRQYFLENLSKSANFPQLYALDYADPFNGELDDDFTPFDVYLKLFSSPIFTTEKYNFHFKLRNSNLSKEQLQELRKVNARVQFLYIDSKRGDYVR